MKTIDFLLLGGLVMCLLFILTWQNEDRHHKEQKELIEQRFNKLDSLLQHRSELDSLYWNHLEECSFELKDELSYSNYN